MSNLKEVIKDLAKGSRQTVSLICTVDAVDKTARTVDCSPLDESAPLLGVNLQANQGSSFGVVAFPKPDSFVVVGFVADGSAGVVLLMDEIESIEVVIGENAARITADENGICALMGDATSVELTADGITLNGGKLGGVVKVEQLTERINAIEKDINTLKSIFSAWVAVPQDGGGALSIASSTWAGTPLTLTERSDYENEKVTHG